MSDNLSLQLTKKSIAARKRAVKCVALLSPAERAVYDRIVQGKSASEIADELHRSTFTISNHTRRIFKAFGTQSRSKLLAMLVVPLNGS